jgi:hypothetical protein
MRFPALSLGVAATLALGAGSYVAKAEPQGRPQSHSDEAASAGVDVALPDQVNLTNAGMKLAVSTGDVAKVMDLRGSPNDVIEAMRSRFKKDANAVLNPNAERPVPVARWLQSIDENLARGLVPSFIQDQGQARLAFFDDAGRMISVTTVPGMNTPGRAPVGIPYNVPVPPPPPPLPPSPTR